MVEQLDHPGAARDLERAVREAIAQGVRTPDIGGRATTRELAEAIADLL
jgi:isocitrate/isopropylmalate dehydrogenase